MTQKELFDRDEYAALVDDVDAIGRKETAFLLRSMEEGFDPDAFDAEEEARWISSCLSRKRGHKFGLEQITTIINEARKKGSYSYITWLLNKTYFEPPVPKAYDVEVQRIGLKLEKINGALEQTMAQLKNLDRELRK